MNNKSAFLTVKLGAKVNSRSEHFWIYFSCNEPVGQPAATFVFCQNVTVFCDNLTRVPWELAKKARVTRHAAIPFSKETTSIRPQPISPSSSVPGELSSS